MNSIWNVIESQNDDKVTIHSFDAIEIEEIRGGNSSYNSKSAITEEQYQEAEKKAKLVIQLEDFLVEIYNEFAKIRDNFAGYDKRLMKEIEGQLVHMLFLVNDLSAGKDCLHELLAAANFIYILFRVAIKDTIPNSYGYIAGKVVETRDTIQRLDELIHD